MFQEEEADIKVRLYKHYHQVNNVYRKKLVLMNFLPLNNPTFTICMPLNKARIPKTPKSSANQYSHIFIGSNDVFLSNDS